MQDFRGALARLLTCTNDQNAFYRPSLTSQYQHRINAHFNSTNRNQSEHQNRLYIDSPVWKREQQIETCKGSRQTEKDITELPGKGKWDKEAMTLKKENQPKTDFIKNYETIELQASALYRISNAAKNSAGAKNDFV